MDQDGEIPDAMGNLMSRSLGTAPPPDPGGLSMPGRHVRATTAVTGQVDTLGFTYDGTKPKISAVTSNGLDHTVSYDSAGNETGYFATRTYSPRNLMNAVIDTAGEGPAHQITYGYDYRGVRVSRTESPTDAGSASRYEYSLIHTVPLSDFHSRLLSLNTILKIRKLF